MRLLPLLVLGTLLALQAAEACRIVCSKKGSSVIHCYDDKPDTYRFILYPAEDREVIIRHLSCTLSDENRMLIDCKGDSPRGKVRILSKLRTEKRVVARAKGSTIEESGELGFEVWGRLQDGPDPLRRDFQFDMMENECGSAAEG